MTEDQETPESSVVNKIDEQNKKNLLSGNQIEMLKEFLKSKNKEQIVNIGSIYYFFSKYWPEEIVEEIKSRKKIEENMEPQQIIDDNKPLNFFSTSNTDWDGIKNTLSLLESVRSKVLRNQGK